MVGYSIVRDDHVEIHKETENIDRQASSPVVKTFFQHQTDLQQYPCPEKE